MKLWISEIEARNKIFVEMKKILVCTIPLWCPFKQKNQHLRHIWENYSILGWNISLLFFHSLSLSPTFSISLTLSHSLLHTHIHTRTYDTQALTLFLIWNLWMGGVIKFSMFGGSVKAKRSEKSPLNRLLQKLDIRMPRLGPTNRRHFCQSRP